MLTYEGTELSKGDGGPAALRARFSGANSLYSARASLHPGLERGEQRLRVSSRRPCSSSPDAMPRCTDSTSTRVLAADLVVEREELREPALVDAGREEVVEVALGAAGAVRRDRADREVRRAGEDVDAGVRVEQMELPALAGLLRAAQYCAENVGCASSR